MNNKRLQAALAQLCASLHTRPINFSFRPIWSQIKPLSVGGVLTEDAALLSEGKTPAYHCIASPAVLAGENNANG